jgi:prepilin-type processing-associated H-X9-DG protein
VLRPSFPDVKNILLCPEASTPSYGNGSATSAWGPYDPAKGSPATMAFVGNNFASYGINGWLYSTADDMAEGSLWIRARLADRIPVFAESTWVDGWPAGAQSATPETLADTKSEEAGIVRFQIARHGQSINISFLDGHAEQWPLQTLGSLQWTIPNRIDRLVFPSR